MVRQDLAECGDATLEAGLFTPKQPREKWQKRRTTIKLRVSHWAVCAVMGEWLGSLYGDG